MSFRQWGTEGFKPPTPPGYITQLHALISAEKLGEYGTFCDSSREIERLQAGCGRPRGSGAGNRSRRRSRLASFCGDSFGLLLATMRLVRPDLSTNGSAWPSHSEQHSLGR